MASPTRLLPLEALQAGDHLAEMPAQVMLAVAGEFRSG
jgi:hypothetical protein